ncbi:MAG: hypothetical protein J0H64_00725, partial [Actinobacteria bacterium]|nr:hypothetical protein [Actinomycetota bacterium]
LRSDEIARLTEDTMTRSQTDTATQARRPERSRRRGLLLGGLGVIIAGAAAAIAIPLLVSPGAPSTQLQQRGVAAKCMPIDASMLAQASSAFRGTVTGVEQGVVTIRVTERFAGKVGDTVEVPQGDGVAGPEGEVVASDGGPLTFEPGKEYLIAVSDGAVSTCGMSGTADPELEQLYREAFPG